MTTIHKITWDSRYNRTNKKLEFEIIEEDCWVKSVSHPILKWMVDSAWVHCYAWLKKKHADIVSEEKFMGDEFPHPETNPRRLSDREWHDRMQYTKG